MPAEDPIAVTVAQGIPGKAGTVGERGPRGFPGTALGTQGPWDTEAIENFAITAEKIAGLAVTEAKIAAEAVTAGKIATGAVTAAKLGALAVETAAIAAGAVTEAKLAASAVTAGKIATGAVTAAKLAAEAVETAAIKAEAVTGAKIAVGAVGTSQIAASAVTAAKLAANAVTGAAIAAGSIEPSHLGTVITADLTSDEATKKTVEELVAAVNILKAGGGITGTKPTVTNPGPQTTPMNNAVDLQITSVGATSFTMVSGLPVGLIMSTSTGEITGVPTVVSKQTTTIKANNSVGSTEISFTWEIVALAGVPVATTEAAEEVSAAKAKLVGSVNPKGIATKYKFEYGPSLTYGTSTLEGLVGSGTAAVKETAVVTSSGMLLGAALDHAGVVEKAYESGTIYVTKFLEHFDSWTPENELKSITTFNSGGRSMPLAANVTQFREMYEALKTANGGVDKLIRAHNLYWSKNEYTPEWLTNPTVAWTETTLNEALEKYITLVVKAVAAITPVSCWDVLNEVVSDGGELNTSKITEALGGSLAITATNPAMKVYANLFKFARAANPTAKLFANEYNVAVPGKEAKTAAVLTFAKVMLALGAPINGIGVQMHQNTEWGPSEAEIEAFMVKAKEIGMEVEITECDIELKGAGTTTTQGTIAKAIAKGAQKGGMNRLTCWGYSDAHSYQGANTLTTGLRPLPYDVESKVKPFGTELAAVKGKPLESTLNYRIVALPTGQSPIPGLNMTLTQLGSGTTPVEEASKAGPPVLHVTGKTVEWAAVGAAGTTETIAVSNKPKSETRLTGYIQGTRTTNPQQYTPLAGEEQFNSEGLQFTIAEGSKVWVGVFENGEWSAEEKEVSIGAAVPVVNNPGTLTMAVGTTVNEALTASNTPTSWTITGLPAGLSASATTGVITGKPTTEKTYTVTVVASNAVGPSTAINFQWVVGSTTSAVPALIVGYDINNQGGLYDWENAKAAGAQFCRQEEGGAFTFTQHSAFAASQGMKLLWIIDSVSSIAGTISAYEAMPLASKEAQFCWELGNEDWELEGSGSAGGLMSGKTIAEGFIKAAKEQEAKKIPVPLGVQLQTSPKEKLSQLEKFLEANHTELTKCFEAKSWLPMGNYADVHNYGTPMLVKLKEANNLGNTEDKNGVGYGSLRFFHIGKYMLEHLGLNIPIALTEIGADSAAAGGAWAVGSAAEVANYLTKDLEAARFLKENKLPAEMAESVPTGYTPQVVCLSWYALYAFHPTVELGGYGVYLGVKSTEKRTESKIFEIALAGMKAIAAAP